MNILQQKRIFSIIFEHFNIIITCSEFGKDEAEIEVICNGKSYKDTVSIGDIKEIVKKSVF